MRMLIGVWLAKWQASLINGLIITIGRLLGPMLEPVSSAAHSPAAHPQGSDKNIVRPRKSTLFPGCG